MRASILLSRGGGVLALSRVSRHLGVLWALMSISGCSERVELLSTPSFEGGGASGAGATTGAGGTLGASGTEGAGGSSATTGTGGGSGSGASGGSGGTDAGMDGTAPPWTTCRQALAFGREGDECSFADDCTTGDRCSYVQATCRDGRLFFARGSDPTCQTPCTRDRQCQFERQWCEAGLCVPCVYDPVTTCEHGWQRAVFARNGCTVVACAPPTECTSSAGCSRGAECYAGQACSPDCPPGDPSCCNGNFCATAGCDPAALRLSCEQSGCPLGTRCAGGEWQRSLCECDGVNWQCRQPPEFFVCQ
jgi:hypothetical protein